MDRREAIRRTSLAMGGAISAPALAIIMKGCAPNRTLEWEPTFFTPEQAMTIEDIAERIIPETDTPGAKALGVPRFIEDMVSTVLDEEDKAAFMEGLTALENSTLEDKGKKFTELNENQQYEILNPMSEQVAAEVLREEKEQPEETKPSFFRILKELTVVGFYTSEVGATQELEFQEIPGNFDGCVPLSELSGKTWAT